MLSYNLVGKRSGFPGNLMVSSCVSLPFIFGGAIVGSITGSLIIFSLMAFLANTGREVTKGIADIKGDKSRNIKTLAVTHGLKKAGKIAAVFYLAAVAISPTPFILGWLSSFYLIIVSIADLGFLYSSTRLFIGVSPQQAHIVKTNVLYWMLIVLVSFLVGNI
jgi:geranylgeranylglycerol-phosphate geranylgeranyltransferase